MLNTSPFYESVPGDFEAVFDRYNLQVEALYFAAKEFQVATPLEAQKAITIAGDAKRLYKKLDTLRKELTEPARRFTTEINDRARIFTDRLKGIEEELVDRVEEWKEELARKAQQLSEEDILLAEVLGDGPMEQNIPSTVRGKGAITYEKKSFEWKAINCDQIPREYLKPDPEAIQKAIESGVRQIAGLQIYEISKTFLRTR